VARPPAACPPVTASRRLPMFPFLMRRDGWPELVITVVAMAVLPRRRDEIGEPVEELKWQEGDDAVRPRPRRLSRAARADPVGGLVSGEHVVDFGCATACVTRHGEPFHRKGRPGTVPQSRLRSASMATRSIMRGQSAERSERGSSRAAGRGHPGKVGSITCRRTGSRRRSDRRSSSTRAKCRCSSVARWGSVGGRYAPRGEYMAPARVSASPAKACPGSRPLIKPLSSGSPTTRRGVPRRRGNALSRLRKTWPRAASVRS
jgi:hypothetical protein